MQWSNKIQAQWLDRFSNFCCSMSRPCFSSCSDKFSPDRLAVWNHSDDKGCSRNSFFSGFSNRRHVSRLERWSGNVKAVALDIFNKRHIGAVISMMWTCFCKYLSNLSNASPFRFVLNFASQHSQPRSSKHNFVSQTVEFVAKYITFLPLYYITQPFVVSKIRAYDEESTR